MGLSPSVAPLFVMHVGAGTPAKQWPAEHWRELIGRIVFRHAARVVLVGGRSDRIIARRILGDCPDFRSAKMGLSPSLDAEPAADWTGRLGIVELAALLEAADLFVGADSGPAHLAAAVGTPGVVLFSGTNSPRQWRPPGPLIRVVRHPVECSPCHRERCPLAEHPCMNGLKPSRMAALVDELYGERFEKGSVSNHSLQPERSR